jgi:hypothetical protein
MEIQPYDVSRLEAIVRLSLRAWAPVFESIETAMDPEVCPVDRSQAEVPPGYTTSRTGFIVRTFDLEKRQWSIYWVSSASGRVDVPVVGGFEGDRGEFYGEDRDNGRPVKVGYTWVKLDRNRARWEQAFSYDDHSWETNWTADFTRADPATTCEAGRPKRQVAGTD